jgi:hypothetical protein
MNIMPQDGKQGEVIIYEHNGTTRVDVKVEGESVWLNQKQLSELFWVDRSVITKHIKNIFESGELDNEMVCANFAQTTKHGAIKGKTQSKEVLHYNLDMIVSLGYRINSKIATGFRIWATGLLKEYMIKGFTMDDERIKNLGGGNYWKELIERIRDIRSSEKVFYRQVLDIYATSIDYDPKSDTSVAFFKMVQNKIHYAVHGKTAPEIIHSRVSAEKDFMGLSNFIGEKPTLAEAKIAKNYLSKQELEVLNQLVEGYLAFAERQANRHVVMTMKDWVNHLDKILTANGEELLKNAGEISHKVAIDKVHKEYKEYQSKTLSCAERDYLTIVDRIQELEERAK